MTVPDLIALTRDDDRPFCDVLCESAARAAVDAQTRNAIATMMMDAVYNSLMAVSDDFGVIANGVPQKGDTRVADEIDRLKDDYEAAATAWKHFQERFDFVSAALLRRVSHTAHATTETAKEAWQ